MSGVLSYPVYSAAFPLRPSLSVSTESLTCLLLPLYLLRFFPTTSVQRLKNRFSFKLTISQMQPDLSSLRKGSSQHHLVAPRAATSPSVNLLASFIQTFAMTDSNGSLRSRRGQRPLRDASGSSHSASLCSSHGRSSQ